MIGRHLIEKAAASLGLEISHMKESSRFGRAFSMVKCDDGKSSRFWNPLVNSGDALELAAGHRMDVLHGENDLGEPIVTAQPAALSFSECPAVEFTGPESIREAITRSAAKVGGEA